MGTEWIPAGLAFAAWVGFWVWVAFSSEPEDPRDEPPDTD